MSYAEGITSQDRLITIGSRNTAVLRSLKELKSSLSTVEEIEAELNTLSETKK